MELQRATTIRFLKLTVSTKVRLTEKLGLFRVEDDIEASHFIYFSKVVRRAVECGLIEALWDEMDQSEARGLK